MSLTVLNVSYNQLSGFLTPGLSGLIFATEVDIVLCAGPLPKVLPTSLEVLDLSGGNPVNYPTGTPHKFTGGIPSEWGALTNLKELKMAFCGLDGKPLSIRTERLRILADTSPIGR